MEDHLHEELASANELSLHRIPVVQSSEYRASREEPRRRRKSEGAGDEVAVVNKTSKPIVSSAGAETNSQREMSAPNGGRTLVDYDNPTPPSQAIAANTR